MSCARCAPGCRCGDFSSKAAGLPSLVSIETVGDILSQAVKNTAGRSEAVAAGDLSPEELQAADERLANWLATTFSGGNPHFASGEDWNPNGLSLYLQDAFAEAIEATVGMVPEDPEEVICGAVAVFMTELYAFLSDFARGGFSVTGAEATPMGAAFINRWARLFTGAPEEMIH